MDRREAIITLRANVIYACESAGFHVATINLVNEALDLAIEALQGAIDQNQITGKLENAENATSEGEESTMGQLKSKLDCISRQQAVEAVTNTIREKFSLADWYEQLVETGLEIENLIKELPPVTPKVNEDVEDMGEVSDGYHTFNQLYHQRAVLFATIVKQNKDKAWKSWKHEDGKFCFDKGGEWFIVGVDTPEGSYTYHYEKKYWDMFDCEELDRGKHWDGHTEDDVTRLLSLPPVTPTEQQEHGRLIDADKLLQETFIVDEEEWTTPEIRAILENAPPVEPKRPNKKSCW